MHHWQSTNNKNHINLTYDILHSCDNLPTNLVLLVSNKSMYFYASFIDSVTSGNEEKVPDHHTSNFSWC